MGNPKMLCCPIKIAFMLKLIYFPSVLNRMGVVLTRQPSHSDDANMTSVCGNQVVVDEKIQDNYYSNDYIATQ